MSCARPAIRSCRIRSATPSPCPRSWRSLPADGGASRHEGLGASRQASRSAGAVRCPASRTEAWNRVGGSNQSEGGRPVPAARVKDVKVNAEHGQACRTLVAPVDNAVARGLAAELKEHGGSAMASMNDADHRSVNRALRPSGLSIYSFRHPVASKLKREVIRKPKRTKAATFMAREHAQPHELRACSTCPWRSPLRDKGGARGAERARYVQTKGRRAEGCPCDGRSGECAYRPKDPMR